MKGLLSGALLQLLLVSTRSAGPAFPAWGSCDPDVCLDLHLIYTSKLGGRFLPVDSRGTTCDPNDSGSCYGGSARRAAYVEERRREYALQNESVAFMDLGGSTFGGPLWEHPDYPRGRPAALLQNLLPYDFCGFSPRDFLNQEDNTSLRELSESFAVQTCPFLLANVRFNGLWRGFNARVVPWAVKEMQNGWKVAFIGFFPRSAGYGFNYGTEVVTLDQRSLLSRIEANNYSESELKMSGSSLSAADGAVGGDYRKLDSYTHDVVLLASVVPSDVLAAQAEVRRAHPDLKATVLLVGDNERGDQVRWLAQNTDVDIVLREYRANRNVPSEWVQSLISSKRVLLAGGETVLGVGHIKARLHPTLGVQELHVETDFPLDSSIGHNATVHAAMDQLYEGIRRKLAQPFGTITNPLVGGGRGAEQPPSKRQCYYTDCNAAEVVGAAMLWKALSSGHEADVSLYNLGGLRTTLVGDANATIFAPHCAAILRFQNTLKLFRIMGQDLYQSILKLMREYDRGLVGAGVRVSFHEPCFSFVNHTNYLQDVAGPPGHSSELSACQAATGFSRDEMGIKIINIEVKRMDWARCRAAGILVDCPHFEWRTLEKGTMYTLVSTDYLSGELVGYRPAEIALGTDAEALCNYIRANSPLQVQSWEQYAQKGSTQYARAEDGWSQGMRVVSVQTAVSEIAAAPTCPDGLFLHPLAVACQPCEVGKTSSSDPARASCTECAMGFYSNRTGAVRCQRCPAGHFNNQTASAGCMPCGAGQISEAGASSCIPCQEGQFSAAEASGQCTSCPTGTYSSAKKSTTCTPCGGDLVTRYPGMISAAACVCPANTYRPLPLPSAGNASSLAQAPGDRCLPCPAGMECALGSDMRFLGMPREGIQQHPVLLPQRWSSLEDPLSVYQCRSDAKCPGGSPGSACATGLMGQACEWCEGNAFWNGKECRECLGSPLVFPAVPALVVPILVVAMYHGSKAPLSRWNNWQNGLGLLFFVALNYYQITGLMKDLNIRMPETSRTTLGWWAWTGDVLMMFSANCIGFSDFKSRMIRGSLVPLGVILMALLTLPVMRLVARQFSRPKWDMEFAGLHNVIGSLLFTFFGGIANQALTLFKCQGNPNGKITLVEDAAINCYEGGLWQSMLVVGILSVLIYCVGVGVLFIRAVLVAHHHGNFSNPDFQWRWKFLFVKYRAQVYWFGVVHLTKNIFFNLAFVSTRIDIGQLMWLLTVVLLYTCFVVAYMPFRFRAANILELIISLSFIYNIAYLIWFSDRGNSAAESALPIALRVSTFVPIASCVPCALLIFAHYSRKNAMRRSTNALFDRVQSCCEALVYMDPNAGGGMLMDLQEGDRREMERFCTLVEAEVMGHHGKRLVSGFVSNNSFYQGEIRRSKEAAQTTRAFVDDTEVMEVLRKSATIRNSTASGGGGGGDSDMVRQSVRKSLGIGEVTLAGYRVAV